MSHIATQASGAKRSVAIVGAGVVGAATALALASQGHLVTVFDHGEIGAGTSSGNAGGIVTGAVTPTATPGVLRSIPSYIFDPNGAAVLRPSYFFKVLPWLVRFIEAGRPTRVSNISQALEPLVSKAMQSHLELADLCGCRHLIQPVGWLKVYGTDAGFAESALDRELMARYSVNFSILSAAEVADLEPKLNRNSYTRGLFQPDSGFVNYPTALTQAYFEGARRRQAQYLQEYVSEIQPTDSGGIAVKTDKTNHQFDDVIIAAGAFSKKFVDQIGDKVCLDTERGYHISFASTGNALLRRPVGFPEKHCVLSPMHDGISLVSGDELAGLNAPPDYRRIRAMAPFARSVLPGLAGQEIQREWMGFRPSTPDSLPVIGRSPKCNNVFYAFGHGHLGLTLAAITAQLVAGMVTGFPDPFDLAPYRIARF
jgi:D-amino-acid dehydrogenase